MLMRHATRPRFVRLTRLTVEAGGVGASSRTLVADCASPATESLVASILFDVGEARRLTGGADAPDTTFVTARHAGVRLGDLFGPHGMDTASVAFVVVVVDQVREVRGFIHPRSMAVGL
jgi:hypothetical protein